MRNLKDLTDEELQTYHQEFVRLNTNSRFEGVKSDGFDLKFAYHLVRLLSEAEQLLTTGEMDLRLNNEHYKAIRNGEVPLEEIEKWSQDKEKQLEKAYHESKLPWGPREAEIKELLLKCLEMQYGSLDKFVKIEGREIAAIRKVKELLKDFN